MPFSASVRVSEGDEFVINVGWSNHNMYEKMAVEWQTNTFRMARVAHTATPDVDYVSRLRFRQTRRESGDMNHTFATHEDDLYEGDETYEAGYSKATGGSDIDGDRYCQVTIVDDDELKVVNAWFNSAPADGYTYRTGEWIEVNVKHNGKVAVHGDTLLWFLFSDLQYRRFNYRRGSGSDTLAFGYQVQVGDRNLNHRLSPVGGHILGDGNLYGVWTDSSHHTEDVAMRALPPGFGQEVNVDGRPYVTDLEVTSSPSQGSTYGRGESIELSMTFDQAVEVVGEVALSMRIGEDQSARWWRGAQYRRGSGSDTLVFAYEVQTEDLDDDGISVVAGHADSDGTITSGFSGTGTIEALDTDVELDPRYSGFLNLADHKVNGRAYLSTEAKLSHLSLSDGMNAVALNPAFDAQRTRYTASVGNAVSSLTVAARTTHDAATVAYLDVSDMELTDAGADTNGYQVTLASGVNTFKAKVTAEDELTTETYTVVVTRGEVTGGVCDRTEQVKNGLVTATGADNCSLVTDDMLAAITVLNLNDTGLRALHRDDFDGLTSLKFLYLEDNELTLDGLPAGIFTSLPSIIEQIGVRGNPDCPERGNGCFPPPITVTATSDGSDGLTVRSGRTVVMSADTGSDLDPLGRSLNYGWSQKSGPSANLSTSSDGRTASFIAPQVSATETVKFSATVTPASNGTDGRQWAKAIRDAFWEEVVVESAEIVILPPLTVESIGFTSDPNDDNRAGDDDTYAIGDSIEVTVTFNDTVTVDTMGGGGPHLTLDIGGATYSAPNTAGSGSPGLVFMYEVEPGMLDTDGMAIPANPIALDSSTIKKGDGSGPDAVLTFAGEAADSRHKVDGVPPVPARAATSGDGMRIVLGFNEALSPATLGAGAFALAVNRGAAPGVNTVAVSGDEATLTLAHALHAGQAVSLTYTDPGDDDAIEDRAGNDAASFTAGSGGVPAVVNNAPVRWAVTFDPETIEEDAGVSTLTVSTGGATFADAKTIALTPGGTADEGTDYTIASTSLTLAPGETEVSTTITAKADTEDSMPETVTITAMIGTEQIGETQTLTIEGIERPGAPRSFDVAVNTGYAQLAWLPPESVGGGPITGYEYRRKEGSGSYGDWQEAGDADSRRFDDYDVSANTTYVYRVRAVNGGGGGAASDEVSATVGPPIEVGADPLEYEVAETAGSVTIKVVARVPRNWDVYDREFEVTASTESASATSFEDYRPITESLAFVPSDFTNMGGQYIATKDVSIEILDKPEAEDEESFVVLVEPTSGLNAFFEFPDATDTATVRIVDDDHAPLIEPRQLNVVLDRTEVGRLRASDADGDALTWRIVGGADGDQFELTEDGVLSVLTARTSATLANPDDHDGNGFYEVEVEVSDGGNPVTATLSLPLLDAEPASTPLRLHVGAGDGEATAYWSAPASDGGAPIERYEYWVHRSGRDSPLTGRTCPEEVLAQGERACALFLQSGEPEDWTPVPGGAEARRVTVGNLVNGKLYQFKVRAVNAAGPGMYAWDWATPYAEPSEAPELTVTLADRTVDDTVTTVAVARWTEPANPAGLPLVGYLFEGSRDGVEWANADGSHRSENFYSAFIGSCSETYHSPCDPEFNTRRLVLEAHMTDWHFRVQALYSAGTLEVHADAPEEAKNKLRVCSPFSNVARAGEDGTLPEAEPLTVRFEGKPGSHSGTPFSFRVVFNQAVEIDEAGFAAHALVVGNGTLTAAARVEARRGAWSVTIEPDSVAAVSVSLANPPCGEPGAVCTALGGRLEVAPAEMVPGPAPGVVTGLELVDTASGGETVTLTDGATVRLATPSAHRYGLMATVASADVKSVGLALRGPGPNDRVTKTENYEPWSLTGDTNGKAHGRALPVGSYTLVATAYAQMDLGGAALGTRSVAFTVAAASDTAVVVDTDAPVLTGFELVDTALNGKLATLSDGSTVELADPSADRYGIVAQVAPGGGVKSVTLSLSGSNKSVSPRVESVEPWSLYGDDLQDPYGEDLPAGSYTLSATAHSEIKGAGAVLGTLSVRFTVQGPPALSVADAAANESEGSIAFAVTLDRAAPGPVTVEWATADGSATAGEDYTGASGTLRFDAGETSKTLAVALLDDAVDDGGETFTVSLSNASGAVIADGEAVGTIENADPMPSAWLVRFGRTVGGQVVDAVTARFEAPGASHVTLGGERLSLEGETGDAPQGADRRDGDDEQAARDTLLALADRFGGSADGGGRDRGQAGVGTGDGWLRNGAGADARTMTGRELLLGSSFHLAAGGGDGAASVAAWGRVATGGFDAEVDEVRLDGEVTTAMLGADVGQGRWLAGAAVAYSEGTGGYALTSGADSAFDTGEVESRLTTLFPYARLALSERVSAWGLVGYGTGTLTLTEAHGEAEKRYTTDIGLRMGAVGARGTLVAPEESGGFELAIRTDAMLLRTTSDATDGMAASQSDASRLRLILDGSRSFEMGAGTLTPRVELGLRHDGGDAETGTGVEVGAGLRYQGEGVAVEGAVRGLLAHEDEGYREWGASGSVRIDPGASGRGLSLTLSPTWGAASSGTERLWGLRDASGLGARDDAFDPGHRLDAEMGYGFAVLDERGVATPYAGWSRSSEGETLRLGQRLRLGQATEWRLEGEFGEDERIWRAGYGYRLGSGLTFTTEASRREPANDNAPEHALVLRASMRW